MNSIGQAERSMIDSPTLWQHHVKLILDMGSSTKLDLGEPKASGFDAVG